MNTQQQEAAQETSSMDLRARAEAALYASYRRRAEPDEEILGGLIELESRERYLEWVSNWKATYKALSAEIREKKAVLRTVRTPSEMSRHMIARKTCSDLATLLLAVRALGKVESAKRRRT